jgi:hypothetical protein
VERQLRERVARLSLEQKVRLLTGADFWSLHRSLIRFKMVWPGTVDDSWGRKLP